MKYNVLSKALDNLRNHGKHTKIPEIIVCASICDYLKANNLLKERLSTNLSDDFVYLIDNHKSFSQLKDHLTDIEIRFFDQNTELFYKELKEESFVGKDLDAEDQDILEIVSNKLISKTESFDFFSKKSFAPAITSWLTEGKTGLKAYSPFNNLFDIDSELSADNSLLIATTDHYSLLAKMIYLCCKGRNSISLLSLTPMDLKTPTNRFDIAFSFPPIAIRLERHSDFFEIKLIEDLLERVSERFCVITIVGMSNSSSRGLNEFREKIINTGKLQSVVELPGGFVPFSGLSCLAWCFDCNKNNNGNVTFIDLSRNECKDKKNSGRTLFEFNDYAIKNLTNGLNHKEDELVKNVSLNEIKANGNILTPSRYVLSKEEQEAKNKILQGDTKLSDVVEILRTQIIRPLDDGNTYYEVSASDINQMGVIENPSRIILQTEDNVSQRNLLKKDDIIFALKGSIGKVGLVTEEQDNWLLNQSFVILRVKNKNWPVEFVFRQLKSNNMKIYLQSQAIGSVIPSLSVADLKDIPLVSPTKELIDEQKRKHERQVELTKQLHEITAELEELNCF